MLIISNIKSGEDLQDKEFYSWLVENVGSIDIQRIDSHNVYRFHCDWIDLYELKKWVKDNGHGPYSFKITYNYE
jgi:hypothetical protein